MHEEKPFHRPPVEGSLIGEVVLPGCVLTYYYDPGLERVVVSDIAFVMDQIGEPRIEGEEDIAERMQLIRTLTSDMGKGYPIDINLDALPALRDRLAEEGRLDPFDYSRQSYRDASILGRELRGEFQSVGVRIDHLVAVVQPGNEAETEFFLSGSTI